VRAETRDTLLAVGGLAILAVGGIALIAHATSKSTPQGGAPPAPTPTPTPGGGGNNVKPSVDPWGDLKTQIQLLQLAANNLRADAFVNHPLVWPIWDPDSNAVANDALNMLTRPDGTPTKPPASLAALTQLDADATKLFQDAAVVATAITVPATTKMLVAAVATATLGVTRAAFTAGV